MYDVIRRYVDTQVITGARLDHLIIQKNNAIDTSNVSVELLRSGRIAGQHI